MKKQKLILAYIILFIFVIAISISIIGCVGGTSGNEKSQIPQSNEKTDTGQMSEKTGAPKELIFTSWANTGEIAVLSKAVDKYNEMQDEYKVIFQNAPGEGYEQKLITSLAGGTGPDVFYAGESTVAKVVANGTAAELTEFLKSDKSYVKPEEFSEGLWGAAKTLDGKIYGLTVDCNPVLLYYSPKMFKELGIKDPQEYFDEGNWTWETFDDTLDKLLENGKKGFIMNGDPIYVYSFVYGNGGTIWDGDTYRFDDKAKEAFKYIVDRIQDGRFTYAGSLPKGQGADASFISGQVGYVTAGRWFTPTFHEAGIDFDYIPYPTRNGEKYGPVFTATAYMCVNSNSKNLEGAMEFASFYCSKEGQAARLGGIGNAIPSITGIDDIVIESGVPEHVEHILKIREVGIANGSEQMRDGRYPGFGEDLKAIFEETFVNNASYEETIKKAEEKANEHVAKSKK